LADIRYSEVTVSLSRSGNVGNRLLGTRLKRNGVIVSESDSGYIFNPLAGEYILEKLCLKSNGVWVVVSSVLVSGSESGACPTCDCYRFADPFIRSMTLSEPGIFSAFSGTYLFSSPACHTCQVFNFPQPANYEPYLTAWNASCDRSGFDGWAAASPMVAFNDFTRPNTGGGNDQYRHYYWPWYADLGANMLGLRQCAYSGVRAMLFFEGFTLKKTPSNVCSAFLGRFYTGHTVVGQYPCSLKWSMPHTLQGVSPIIPNPLISTAVSQQATISID